MSRTIDVVAHDPAWQSAFEQEARLLVDLFADRLVETHHIGSTAVPGLAAKPIIDILVVVDTTHDIESFYEPFRTLGYDPRGECLDARFPGTPGRFYFSKNDGEVRTHHVHVCAQGHFQIADLLAVRDYLRTHDEVAAEYGKLKKELAENNRHDGYGYMSGKDAFVTDLVSRARRWREASGTRHA